jgi:hypothetical protein
VAETGRDPEEPTMTALLYNIPLMVLFFALWVGVPMWLVVRRPDTGPQPAETPAVASLPAGQPGEPGYPAAA